MLPGRAPRGRVRGLSSRLAACTEAVSPSRAPRGKGGAAAPAAPGPAGALQHVRAAQPAARARAARPRGGARFPLLLVPLLASPRAAPRSRPAAPRPGGPRAQRDGISSTCSLFASLVKAAAKLSLLTRPPSKPPSKPSPPWSKLPPPTRREDTSPPGPRCAAPGRAPARRPSRLIGGRSGLRRARRRGLSRCAPSVTVQHCGRKFRAERRNSCVTIGVVLQSSARWWFGVAAGAASKGGRAWWQL